MEKWKSQSSSGKQFAAAAVSIVLGMALFIGFHNFDGPEMTNSKAGFLLGVLLLVIGIAGLLVQGRQTVLVDPASGRITIEDHALIGRKRRSIAFSDITGIGIGYLGRKSNYVTCYYLVLNLRNGEKYPLFAPGRFYEGASDRSVVEGWKMRLENYLRKQSG